MALKVEIPYSKVIASPRDLKSTYEYFANLEAAIPKNFPGLELFQNLGADKYEWRFQKVEHSGYGIQVAFITEFKKESEKVIRMEPVAKAGLSQLKGEWRFEASGKETKVHFSANLTLELSLPFFLKTVAGPLATKELTKLFDRYVSHVSKAISA